MNGRETEGVGRGTGRMRERREAEIDVTMMFARGDVRCFYVSCFCVFFSLLIMLCMYTAYRPAGPLLRWGVAYVHSKPREAQLVHGLVRSHYRKCQHTSHNITYVYGGIAQQQNGPAQPSPARCLAPYSYTHGTCTGGWHHLHAASHGPGEGGGRRVCGTMLLPCICDTYIYVHTCTSVRGG